MGDIVRNTEVVAFLRLDLRAFATQLFQKARFPRHRPREPRNPPSGGRFLPQYATGWTTYMRPIEQSGRWVPAGLVPVRLLLHLRGSATGPMELHPPLRAPDTCQEVQDVMETRPDAR